MIQVNDTGKNMSNKPISDWEKLIFLLTLQLPFELEWQLWEAVECAKN